MKPAHLGVPHLRFRWRQVFLPTAVAAACLLAAVPSDAGWFRRTAAVAKRPEAANPKPRIRPAMPSDAIPQERLDHYADLSVKWMQDYLRIDTTNPPGHELKAAEFLKRVLDGEGIENEVFEYTPGRANILARIRHSKSCDQEQGGCQRPIVLLSHMDVVSSDARRWKEPPFSGAILDGSMYGRGAQDMKNEGLAQLVAIVMLHREKLPLNRDVIFLATADEEVDDTGSKWMIAKKRELLGNPEFLITEGGENLLQGGNPRYVGVDVAEKAPFWLHVVAHGQPGHGSRPIRNSAPNRLLLALQKIVAYKPTVRLIPIVEQSLHEMSQLQTGARAERLRNIRATLMDAAAREELRRDDSIAYMLTDTIAVTMLGGAEQTNVIPGEAWANLDVRLLPGTNPQDFVQTLRGVVDDPNVTIEPFMGYSEANASPTGTLLWTSIQRASEAYFDGVPVVPRLTSGYTENQMYRELGITCYGFSPYTVTDEEGSTEHGDDERIRVEELRRGPRMLFDVVAQVAGEK